MELIKEIYKKEITKKILVLVVFAIFLYFIRSLINLLLLTFVFTFLIYTFQTFLNKKFFNKRKVNQMVLTIIIYIILFSIIIAAFITYLPSLIRELRGLIFDIQAGDNSNPLIKFVINDIVPITKKIDISGYTGKGMTFAVDMVSGLGKAVYNFFIALVLSLFFMLELKKIKSFTKKFEKSYLSGIYKYMIYFGRNFINSFGKVIEAQFLVATTNAILSLICLSLLHFGSLVVLTVMIFLLSMIPVAGVFISLIPLSIMAYNKGGITDIVIMLVMIAVLHALETYVLNPKFIQAKTNLPAFYVFVILIISEHLIGPWGLIIGIPLFIFFIDLIQNDPQKEIKDA